MREKRSSWGEPKEAALTIFMMIFQGVTFRWDRLGLPGLKGDQAKKNPSKREQRRAFLNGETVDNSCRALHRHTNNESLSTLIVNLSGCQGKSTIFACILWISGGSDALANCSVHLGPAVYQEGLSWPNVLLGSVGIAFLFFLLGRASTAPDGPAIRKEVVDKIQGHVEAAERHERHLCKKLLERVRNDVRTILQKHLG